MRRAGSALVVGLGLVAALATPASAQQPAPGPAPEPAVAIEPPSRVVERVEQAPPGQDPHAGHAHAAAPGAPAPPAVDGHAAAAAPGDGAGLGNGRLAAMMFWLFALATLGGALFVITRRNLVTAVMGMVGTFFALAGLYLMLYASFLAVIQVLVYAGAIMVLFVFVVMILNRPEDEPWALQGLLGKLLAGLAIAYLVARMSGVLWEIKDTPHAAISAPRPVAEILPGQPADFGSVRAVGNTLFRDYLFPFEAVSLVLLAAVVGAIAVARPHHPHEPADESAGDRGPAA